MSLNVSTIFLVPHYNYAFIPEYKRTKYKADKVPDAKLIFTWHIPAVQVSLYIYWKLRHATTT
jgi:hypothetical protein